MQASGKDGFTRREFLVTSATASLAVGLSPYLQGCASDSTDPLPTSKETLFYNGAIYIDADHKVATLLIRDGIVAGIDVNPDQYPRVERVDLEGAAAYPGFNDSHVHLITMAVAGSIMVPTPSEDDPTKLETDPMKIAATIGAWCEGQTAGTPAMGHGFTLSN